MVSLRHICFHEPCNGTIGMSCSVYTSAGFILRETSGEYKLCIACELTDVSQQLPESVNHQIVNNTSINHFQAGAV